LFKAYGPEAGESEETDGSKEAFEGSAQLQDGAGTEIGPATAFEEVSRPILMLNRLRALFFYLGVPVLVLRIWSKLRSLVLPDSFERP
jgi:X-X-X-Leu-X-X-Gly heptad repeat protein